MTRGAVALLLLAAATLGGCAVTPRPAAVAGRPLDDADQLVRWTASGRLAVAVDQEGGSGRFTWQQDGPQTAIDVRGPLGVGAFRVQSDGASLSVTDGNGRTLDTSAAREQLRARLGADLPIANLRYWMLGLAAPGSPATVNAAGEGPGARQIEQDGWRVTCEQYGTAQGWWLPSRLAAVSGAVRIKLIVDGWQVVPAAAGGSP